MDYAEARDLMAAHKHAVETSHGRVGNLARDRKKLGFRTFLYRKESPNDETPETYELQLFNNTIITFAHDSFVINDGGWFSHTTHKRLNEHMPRGFRVHGMTTAWNAETVGFVSTPKGVYPYNMEMNFTYDGSCTQEFSPQSGPAFHKVPAYVQCYLDRLFKDPKSLSPLAYEDMSALKVLGEDASIDTAAMILGNICPSDLIVEAIGDATSSFTMDIDLPAVLKLLRNEGASILRHPKSIDDLAAKTEATYVHEMCIPKKLNLQTLRKDLRQYLINFLVVELGFEAQEWNRRE